MRDEAAAEVTRAKVEQRRLEALTAGDLRQLHELVIDLSCLLSYQQTNDQASEIAVRALTKRLEWEHGFRLFAFISMDKCAFCTFRFSRLLMCASEPLQRHLTQKKLVVIYFNNKNTSMRSA